MGPFNTRQLAGEAPVDGVHVQRDLTGLQLENNVFKDLQQD